jgi:hypothetical protein
MTMRDKLGAMTKSQKITFLRRVAERVRGSKAAVDGDVILEAKRFGFAWTAKDLADEFDDHADRIEAGEFDEEESLEQLKAEAEVAEKMAELLKRYDASSLEALLKRNLD